MSEKRTKVYVWESPVRITHWVNVACMLALSVSGIYISHPFLTAGSADRFIMGWFRFAHLVFAYLFVVSLAMRIYWSFSGNRYASWQSLFPFNSERMSKLKEQMAFYALISRKPPHEIGHTPLAGLTYFLLLVVCGLSAVTGFALHSLHAPNGMMSLLFGWIFEVWSIPMTRLFHYLVMWLVLSFTILHIYIVFFLNSVERNGLLSSIFDGYKYIKPGRAD